MGRALTIENLQSALQECSYNATIQKETMQVHTSIVIDNVHFPLFARILTPGPLYQLLVFIPAPYKDEHYLSLAKLLNLINKTVDLPGFCIDEESHLIFYRTVIPSFDGNFDSKELNRLMEGIKHLLQSFAGAVALVAQGERTVEDFRQELASFIKK